MAVTTQYLVFKVGDWEFALPINSISRVVDTMQSHFLSTLRDGLEGILVFDKRLIPVIRLDALMGLSSANIFAANPDESMIIARFRDYFFAIRVDEILGMDMVPEHEISESDPVDAGLRTSLKLYRYFRGSDPVFIFDISSILENTISV